MPDVAAIFRCDRPGRAATVAWSGAEQKVAGITTGNTAARGHSGTYRRARTLNTDSYTAKYRTRN